MLMKIGLVCPYDIFKNGGVQECVLALKSEFQKLGHSACIITPRPKGVEAEHIDGIFLIGGSRDFNSPFHATTAQISASIDNQSIDNLLSEHQFDILHFHEPWVPIVSRQILARSNTINVATFHAKLPDTIMSKTLEKVITPYTKSILKYIDALTAVSDSASEYVSSLTKTPINIIPNGIDIDKFKRNTNANRQNQTVLFIGRLEKRKGIIYLLRAFMLLKESNPDTKLKIAGDGPDRHKLERFVNDNHISDVEFLGFVDEATKLRLLQEATVYCSPAIYGESFGIVLLEAMVAGAVIVAGDNPGYSGVLRDTGAVSLVNPKDIGEFSRRLNLMLFDKDLRKVWLNWSSDYVAQFDYSLIAKRYLKLYKQTIKERTR